MFSPDSKSAKSILTRLTLALHVIIAIVLYAFSKLPSFDSSAALLLSSGWATSLLRWDVFHFAHIAKEGYVFEYEYAFFPGISLIMRYGQRALGLSKILTEDDWEGYLLAGALASTAVSVGTVHALYDLTLHHFRSPAFAYLTALLSLLSSSPATLRHAPYTEPFFAYLSYKGMLFASKKRYYVASIMFTFATALRSNGLILSGYIVWGLLVEPILVDGIKRPTVARFMRGLPECLLLSLLPAFPYVSHLYNGYMAFCTDPNMQLRPWCSNRVPSIYSYVQSEYWVNGLFRYWTLQQLPNIVLALPVLVLLLHASVTQIRISFVPLLARSISMKETSAKSVNKSDPLNLYSIAPYAIHALLLSIILLFFANTQIALRLASALPITYWAAARLFISEVPSARSTSDLNKGFGSVAARCWVYWSVLWGACSLVTWAVFLPPA